MANNQDTSGIKLVINLFATTNTITPTQPITHASPFDNCN